MQIRNKILAVLLSIIMCVSLFSCKTAPTIPELTPTPTATATPTPASTPTPTPEPTPTTTPEPNVYGFVVGTNDDHGYHSDFFRFGFLVPITWVIYDRSVLNEQNQIDPATTDLETIRKTLIMQLKKSDTVLDFISFSQDDEGYLFVFVIDFDDSDGSIDSETEVLEFFEPSLFDPDEEERKENLVKSTVDFGGVAHPIYRYDVTIDNVQKKGFIFAIKRGTTFALVQMAADYEGEINYVLDTIYSMDEH